MKQDPTRPPPANWPLEHPWLFIYTVITAMLLTFLAVVCLATCLKAALP